MKRKNSQPNAFTLIELLVVIAIIALLLSVIMPALGMVKEKAKSIECLANVRSLGQAFRMYTEQNGGKVFGYGSMGKSNLWLMQVKDQLGEMDKVRYCPSTKMTEDVNPSMGTWGSAKRTWVWTSGVPEPQQGSYAINGYLYSSPLAITMPADEWERSHWESSVVSANSALIPVFLDSAWVDMWPQNDDEIPEDFDLLCDPQLSGNNGSGRTHMYRAMIDRHGGDLSVAFLDGHVESVALSEMWSLKWSRDFRPKAGVQTRIGGSPIYQKK